MIPTFQSFLPNHQRFKKKLKKNFLKGGIIELNLKPNFGENNQKRTESLLGIK